MKPGRHTYSFIGLILMVVLPALLMLVRDCSRAEAAMLSSGTIITNTANATYTDDGGLPYQAVSNTVTVVVAQVFNILITPDGTPASPGQTYSVLPGENYLPYILTNTGNGPDTYGLAIENLGGDDGDLTELYLRVDQNGNGRPDPGDYLYNNNNPPALAPGETLALLVVGNLPAGTNTGHVLVNLTGHSNNDITKTDMENVSRLNLENDGFIRATKSVSAETVLPGKSFTYRIDFTNPGTLPVQVVDIGVDMDNDGLTEIVSGIMVADPLPPEVIVNPYSITFSPTIDHAFPVFAGSGGAWRTDAHSVTGSVRQVGLVITDNPALAPNRSGFMKFEVTVPATATPAVIENSAQVIYGDQAGEETTPTNPVVTRILPVAHVVIDDTDDNGASTGSGSATDPDDLMEIDHAATGAWVSFANEVWNFGNATDIIKITVDDAESVNFVEGLQVIFESENGQPLHDSNGDGFLDTGALAPGEVFPFTTRVFLPEGGDIDDLIVALRSTSGNDGTRSDLTFNRIGRIEGVKVKIEVRIKATTAAQTGTWSENVPLSRKRITVYEYGDGNTPVREKIFITDADGLILYDEAGDILPLYNWMIDGRSYRIALDEDYGGFSYYLTPSFFKSDFDQVSVPGDTFSRKEVTVKVQPDGTKLLVTPLDPAGYVFDAVTGKRIDGSCVTFYKCNSDACDNPEPVDPALLDTYPDGTTFQENAQVSGPTDTFGNSVNKGDGAFEFRFFDYKPAYDGWYYVGVDFGCGVSAADPTLADQYEPVTLDADNTWIPESGKTYQGQRFFIDQNFPGAILLRIPLMPADFTPLKVTKKIMDADVALGDMIGFSITVENQNTTYTVYDAVVTDELPRDIRYAKGSTRIDGKDGMAPGIAPDGRELTWPVGDLAPGQSMTINFYTRPTAGAKEGRHVNTARAHGWSDTIGSARIDSNIATAEFQIDKGVFTDRGYIIGKIYIDDNDNRIQDENEQGVEGVKIYLEDGRYVITDSQGKYHMDNVRPGTHMVKVDKTTLPTGSELAIINNRNVGDPDSTFADVLPGDLFKVNFRLRPVGPIFSVDSEQARMQGQVTAIRTVQAILTDPGSGTFYIKHGLELVNHSKKPLYEIVYREDSPYTPLEGTTTINGAPDDNPESVKTGFEWRVPILQASQTLHLSYLSLMPDKPAPVIATAGFQIEPAGEPIEIPVEMPLLFTQYNGDQFAMTVFFDFAAYQLSDTAKSSLDTIILFLRKNAYKKLYIRLEGHTDNVRISKINEQYASNLELSMKRTASVKAYLRQHLIDTSTLVFPESAEPTAPSLTDLKEGKTERIRDDENDWVVHQQPYGDANPLVRNQKGLGGTPQNRRVSVKMMPLGRQSSEKTYELGDLVKKGVYQVYVTAENLYPLSDLYDVVIYLALPEGLRFIAGTGKLNDHPVEPEIRDDYLGFNVPHMSGEKTVTLTFRVMARDELTLTSLPVSVYAKTKNGKIIHNSGGGMTDEAHKALANDYLPSPSASGTFTKSDVNALKKKIKFGITEPDEDIIQTKTGANIRIAVPLGARYYLQLNGKRIPDDRLGQKNTDEVLGVVTCEYIGVALEKGINRIALSVDGRLTDERSITVAGEVHDITWTIYPEKPPADGKSPAYLILTLRDKTGAPVSQNGYVTVRVDKGDIFDKETNQFKRFTGDGFKAKVVGGQAVAKLAPSETTEKRTVSVEYGNIERSVDVRFYPEQRPWIIAGELNAGVGFSKQKNDPEKQSDAPFDHSKGDVHIEGRSAVFAKGSIKGYTTTIRYDTQSPNERNTLLLDNTPSSEDNRFYPVYGDESEQFFEAKSSRRLYLKVEKELSYLLIGDYNTDFGTNLEYNTYKRTFTGGLFNIEEDKAYRIKGFISENNQTMVREAIPGRGLSGPYFFGNNDVVVNSEKVWIETRDRYNPDRILDTKQMARYADYSIDYAAGWIIFNQPVRSFDEDLNPVAIQVIYETQNLAEDQFMYGARVEKDFFDGKLTIGASGVAEEHPIDDKHLYGADITYDDNKNIKVTAEIAGTQSYDETTLDGTSGNAGGVTAEYRTGRDTSAEAYYKKVNNGFQNLSATNADESYETYGVKGKTAFNDGKTRLTAEVLIDNTQTTDRKETEALVHQDIFDFISGTAGFRWNHEDGANGTEEDVTQAIFGIRIDPTEKLSLSLNREQSISDKSESDFYPDKTVGKIDYSLTDDTSLYATSELQEKAEKDVMLTTCGIDSRLDENTTAFSKYTIDDSVSGWRNQSHLGLEHQYIITRDFSSDFGAELVKTFSGDETDDYIAPRIGFTYLQKDRYKMTGRAEERFGKNNTESLFSLGGTVKLNQNNTLFARSRYFDSDYVETDLLLGLAFRPVPYDNLNLLTKFRWKKDNQNDLDTQKYIGSLHFNYQPTVSWIIMGEYAAKWVDVKTVDQTFTDLIRGRILYDITDRFDIGFHAGLLNQHNTNTYTLTWGPEVGARVIKNFWVSAGYNFSGFYDDDFSDANYWAQGMYVLFRIKFDEKSLKLFDNDN